MQGYCEGWSPAEIGFSVMTEGSSVAVAVTSSLQFIFSSIGAACRAGVADRFSRGSAQEHARHVRRACGDTFLVLSKMKLGGEWGAHGVDYRAARNEEARNGGLCYLGAVVTSAWAPGRRQSCVREDP